MDYYRSFWLVLSWLTSAIAIYRCPQWGNALSFKQDYGWANAAALAGARV
jgi:hypothetical protein